MDPWSLWTEYPGMRTLYNVTVHQTLQHTTSTTWSFLILRTCIRSTCQRESSLSDTSYEVIWPYLSVHSSIVIDFNCLLHFCRWNQAVHHSRSRSTCPHEQGLRSPLLHHVHGSSYQADQASSYYMHTEINKYNVAHLLMLRSLIPQLKATWELATSSDITKMVPRCGCVQRCTKVDNSLIIYI